MDMHIEKKVDFNYYQRGEKKQRDSIKRKSRGYLFIYSSN